MISLRNSVLPIILLLVLVSLACSSSTAPGTPATPTPPQITAANSVNALAQTLQAAITGLRTASQQGKLSAADLAAAESVAAIVATAGKSIDAELRSADPWTSQKTTIIGIIAANGLQGATAKLNPAAALLLSASWTLVQQISTAVGGPTL